MRKLGDFLKRIKVKEVNTTPVIQKNNIEDVQIHIEGDVQLFKDEKEKIIEGAKQLLEIGKADDIEDAIITYAMMFRGLSFSRTEKNENGKKTIVLRETAQSEIGD